LIAELVQIIVLKLCVSENSMGRYLNKVNPSINVMQLVSYIKVLLGDVTPIVFNSARPSVRETIQPRASLAAIAGSTRMELFIHASWTTQSQRQVKQQLYHTSAKML
jgi:hypothetical protein